MGRVGGRRRQAWNRLQGQDGQGEEDEEAKKRAESGVDELRDKWMNDGGGGCEGAGDGFEEGG
eukprot:8822354-Pyramimonas_sp.AAC.2